MLNYVFELNGLFFLAQFPSVSAIHSCATATYGRAIAQRRMTAAGNLNQESSRALRSPRAEAATAWIDNLPYRGAAGSGISTGGLLASLIVFGTGEPALKAALILVGTPQPQQDGCSEVTGRDGASGSVFSDLSTSPEHPFSIFQLRA
ncbi:hypothetical protein LJR090_001481 [Bosea sp. LjRoot90]|uniref:hypothetical protein n=1 Tax=Bosea sp. LjRoot90 TaxID=3342342 RepID=UPI003ECD4504